MNLLDIPGWNTQDILTILADLASSVPENGNILEIGALFGRTTCALGLSKKSSVKLTVFDEWSTLSSNIFANGNLSGWTGSEAELAYIRSLLDGNPPTMPGDNRYNAWKQYTAGIQNIEPFREKSPPIHKKFDYKFDLIFHDGSHDFSGVYRDLRYWFPQLKDHCPFIIDDYTESFPGLKKAVDVYVSHNNLQTKQITNNCLLIKH
jgi:hypothetical protein